MKILAISGSTRAASTNTAFLREMQALAPDRIQLSVFHYLDTLPVFSPDLEGEHMPSAIADFLALVAAHDAILIASPEYVHAIPGGLKNAIDWMVSRCEIIGKPIALAHASYRGDDMLASLRLVLATVSDGFLASPFLRIPLIGKTPAEISALLYTPEHRGEIRQFLSSFAIAAEAMAARDGCAAQPRQNDRERDRTN